MNDQSRYIVDSRYFDGTCLTFMTDGFRSDFGGETLEEMRVEKPLNFDPFGHAELSLFAKIT